jgi:predicted LPLAT superfamily acyltransferase
MNSSPNKPVHWSALREAGSMHGLNFLLWAYRRFGRGFYKLLLCPVVVYFFLFRKSARQASQQYLQQHYRHCPQSWDHQPGFLDVLRHFHSFSEAILDRAVAWMNGISAAEFSVLTPDGAEALLKNPRGQLIIGSHFGNLEFFRGFVQSLAERPVNVLLYDQHAANYVKLMQKLNPQSRFNVYQVDKIDIATTLSLKQKIASGEWVFIAGDRIPITGNQRTEQVMFLGKPAPFPLGPYMFAKVLDCPVTLMFAYRLGGKILFEVETLAEKIELPRDNKTEVLRGYIQKFATALEKRCAKAPLQWFNFFDFWNQQ